MKKLLLLLLLHASIVGMSLKSLSGQHNATFDDLSLSPNSFWNGSTGAGGFQNSSFYFTNSYTDYGGGMYAWAGFAYSNQTDTLTTGLDNQFSCIAGTGANGSANYAITYMNSDWMTGAPIPNTIIFDSTLKINGCYVNNNTYAYLSMRDGDAYSKKFGGSSGNDPDWFKISAWGYYQGTSTDTIDFYLADYRFSNNQQDYIIKNWTWWNMDTLSAIDSLKIILSSTDNNAYGLRTPAYFCMDNFTAANPVNVKTKNLLSLHIYPNPVSDVLFVSEISNQCHALHITDITGKVVHSQEINHQPNLRIEVGNLPKGLYFVTFYLVNNRQTLKFQKL